MLRNCDYSAASFAAKMIGETIDRSAAGADDLDIEVADLLSQGIAVDPQEVGSPDLIAAGCRERGRQQRVFDLAQDAVIEARRRQRVMKRREVARQMTFHIGRQGFLGARLLAGG